MNVEPVGPVADGDTHLHEVRVDGHLHRPTPASDSEPAEPGCVTLEFRCGKVVAALVVPLDADPEEFDLMLMKFEPLTVQAFEEIREQFTDAFPARAES